jgi:hypothetical protein
MTLILLHIYAAKFKLFDMVVTLLLGVVSDALYLMYVLSIAVQCAHHCIA